MLYYRIPISYKTFIRKQDFDRFQNQLEHRTMNIWNIKKNLAQQTKANTVNQHQVSAPLFYLTEYPMGRSTVQVLPLCAIALRKNATNTGY